MEEKIITMKEKDTKPVKSKSPVSTTGALKARMELRNRAEKIDLRSSAGSLENISSLTLEDTLQILHELRVYQIELEVQNEELQQAQVELDVSRSRYFDLYDMAPVGYCTFSEKGLVLEANLTAATLLGMSRAALVRQPISRFILTADQDIYYRHRKQIIDTGEQQSFELRIVKQDGTTFWALITAVAAEDSDNNLVFRIVLTDISARKQAEMEINILNTELEQRVKKRTLQLENANKELDTFSYSVAHNLRSPLRGIDGWSMALLEDYNHLLNNEGRIYLGRVRAEAQRMGKLIDNLLELSRVARLEPFHVNVDLTALVQTIVDRLIEAHSSRKFEISIESGLTILCDPSMLEIALTNLLENAFKYTGREPVARIEFGKLAIYSHPTFFVRDNGAGFDMQYANKLFGTFERLHKQLDFPGTGIGLAIVQRIIARHSGRVWAESNPGEGATFYFTIEND